MGHRTDSPSARTASGVDTRRKQVLVPHGQDPAFSADGSRLAFVSDRARNGRILIGENKTFANELYIAKADATDARRVTRSRDRNERYPAWSPDGRRLAYQRGETNGRAQSGVVILTDPSGTCHRTLLADPDLSPSFTAPVWRPGGTVSSTNCHRAGTG